jgi:hypothetical protein
MIATDVRYLTGPLALLTCIRILILEVRDLIQKEQVPYTTVDIGFRVNNMASKLHSTLPLPISGYHFEISLLVSLVNNQNRRPNLFYLPPLMVN